MMRRFLVAAPLVAVVALFGIVAAVAAQTVSSRDYRIEVYAANSGDSAVSGSLPVSLFVDNLVTGGYMADTGDDVIATDASGKVLPGPMLQGLTDDSATWWVPFGTLAADGGTGNSYLYMGDSTAATRDGGIPVQAGDTITVADHSSLDVRSNITVAINADVPTIPPAGEWETLAKRDHAWEIEVGDGDKVRAVAWHAQSSLITSDSISPDATITGALTRSDPNADWWELVQDEGNGDVSHGSLLASGRLRLSADISEWLPTVGFISTMTVYARCLVTSTNSGRSIDLLTVDSSGADSKKYAGVCDDDQWTTVNAPFFSTERQTYEQMRTDGLRFGVTVPSRSSNRTVKIDAVWAVLQYYERSDQVTLDGIEPGALSISFTRDSTDLSIAEGTSDGSASVTSDGATSYSSSDIVVGDGVPAYVRSLRLGGTDIASPTWVVDLQMEPDEVSETQTGTADNSWTWLGSIEDQSSSGNRDGEYSIVRDMSAIDVDVRPLEILASDDLGTLTSSTPPVRVVDDSFAGAEELIGTREQLPGTPFTEPLDEAANAGLLTPEAWWLVIAAMVGLLVAASVAHATRSPTSPTGILPLAAVAYCAVLGAVFMAGKIDGLDFFLSAIAAGSVVSLHQFSRA